MSKRTDKLQGDIGSFIKQYKRKANAGFDPNDRRYDREIEEKIKHMNPEELSELMSGDGLEINSEMEDKWFRFEPIDGVKYLLNDSVEIVQGKNVGEKASIISLVSLLPEPKYFVELSGGNGIEVLESQIKSL